MSLAMLWVLSVYLSTKHTSIISLSDVLLSWKVCPQRITKKTKRNTNRLSSRSNGRTVRPGIKCRAVLMSNPNYAQKVPIYTTHIHEFISSKTSIFTSRSAFVKEVFQLSRTVAKNLLLWKVIERLNTPQDRLEWPGDV